MPVHSTPDHLPAAAASDPNRAVTPPSDVPPVGTRQRIPISSPQRSTGGASTQSGGLVDLLADNDILTPAQQLDQIASFISVHYTDVWAVMFGPSEFSAQHECHAPGDQAQLQFDAEHAIGRLNDIVTHTSQLVLGAGLDHSVPGVAFTTTGPDLHIVGKNTAVFAPSSPTGTVAVSLHGGPGWHGSGEELDIFWRPTIAAIAELSGTTIVDVDYHLPLLRRRVATDDSGNAQYADTPEGTAGIIRDALSGVDAAESVLQDLIGDRKCQNSYDIVTFGSGTVAGLELAAQLNPMRMVVQHPRLLDPTPGDTTWRDHDFGGVDVLIQKATRDTIAVDVDNVTDDLTRGGAHVTVREYLGYHVLATPAVQRHRAQDAAAFLRQKGYRTHHDVDLGSGEAW
ncbi:hypothetical protein ACGE24_04770 [Corynebacterium kroppenstedtii]|uniref:hypothetical protein n=1 Tax=Corynebacterium sp. PCR 32 TaxID=3351342 RepID=UPI0030ACB700